MAKDIRCTLLILAITLFATANLYAQNSKCTIAGKVVDVNQKPIAYASAAVYNATVPITGEVTDNDGKFSLKVGQSNEEFLLVIEFIGYARHEISITPNTSHINIGTITLREEAVSLGIYYPIGKQEFRILKVQMGNSDDKPTNE